MTLPVRVIGKNNPCRRILASPNDFFADLSKVQFRIAVSLIELFHSIDMENYFTEEVRTATPLGGHRLAITFADGFAGEIDLAPLLDWGPLYEPLRDEANFRTVTVSPHGVPEWVDDNFDLSPGTLRAWCEIGKVVSMDETDKWIDAHCTAPKRVA